MIHLALALMIVLCGAATRVKEGTVPSDALRSFQENIRRSQIKEEEEDRPENYRYDVSERSEETKVKKIEEPQQDDEE